MTPVPKMNKNLISDASDRENQKFLLRINKAFYI